MVKFFLNIHQNLCNYAFPLLSLIYVLCFFVVDKALNDTLIKLVCSEILIGRLFE